MLPRTWLGISGRREEGIILAVVSLREGGSGQPRVTDTCEMNFVDGFGARTAVIMENESLVDRSSCFSATFRFRFVFPLRALNTTHG